MPHALVVPVALSVPPASLCARQYPGHPRGCPNLGVKDGCPPRVPRALGEVLDLAMPVYAVWNAFDLGAHVARMKAAHPEWSDRQLVNCLYWQRGARADLRVQLREFYTAMTPTPPPGRRWTIVACPEASGVNVTATLAGAGVLLEWPPRQVAYQVALAGVAVRGSR